MKKSLANSEDVASRTAISSSVGSLKPLSFGVPFRVPFGAIVGAIFGS